MDINKGKNSHFFGEISIKASPPIYCSIIKNNNVVFCLFTDAWILSSWKLILLLICKDSFLFLWKRWLTNILQPLPLFSPFHKRWLLRKGLKKHVFLSTTTRGLLSVIKQSSHTGHSSYNSLLTDGLTMIL